MGACDRRPLSAGGYLLSTEELNHIDRTPAEVSVAVLGALNGHVTHMHGLDSGSDSNCDSHTV